MVWDFYEDKSIFITGGTGFVGTTVLCRLLSQTSPRQIYVLCRGGLHGAYSKWSVFLPHSMILYLIHSDRVTILDGDITSTNMGFSDTDLKRLRESVEIVIHAASSINLRSSLQKVSLSVTVPSLALAKLSLEFAKLQHFVYISTAFANAHLCQVSQTADVAIAEEMYPLSYDCKEIGELAVKEWHQVQKTGTSREYQTHDFPWAYAYAKHLTERLLAHKFSEYNATEKLLIIRPSIIGPSDAFPYPNFSSPSSTPITAYAAGVNLDPGFHMTVTSRCKDPFEDATLDEVPVDVVVDRLLAHLALGTTGCVHAVSGQDGRLPLKAIWHASMAERRLPWDLKMKWTSLDWHSPKIHPIARIYIIIGTSFDFAQDKTIQIVQKLGSHEKHQLKLFADRSQPFSLASRRRQIRYLAGEIAKKKGWPVWLAKLLCRNERVIALEERFWEERRTRWWAWIASMMSCFLIFLFLVSCFVILSGYS